MDYFAVLPIKKYSAKPIEIKDVTGANVGYVKREYKNTYEKIKNLLSFLETRNLVGEFDGCLLEIKEQSFRSNLFKLKWDVYLSDHESNNRMLFLLEDNTKVSTDRSFLYHKNNNHYLFQKDFLSRTCLIYCNDNNQPFAEIKIEKLLPAAVKITIHEKDLSVVEILGIFYLLNLVY
ncbi:hypothetical protein H1D32_16425 [Anaerobacillus sp. CMMVII]|uniref:tubby C-terminal domain-like protein n=1 Tax=Anaerobacillus sp. CMMVII TaxID=2755588 RepID=UPI0021B7586A|nr:hypothetical protein [Anaerobacillus sp. CMMVII]MCT8139151.1 hypothetical protein [Anaerobacillus sp. CMMVII]